MFKKVSPIVVSLLLTAAYAQNDTILNRYKVHLHNSVDTDGDIMKSAVSLGPTYHWEDINYQDTEKAKWKLLIQSVWDWYHLPGVTAYEKCVSD